MTKVPAPVKVGTTDELPNVKLAHSTEVVTFTMTDDPLAMMTLSLVAGVRFQFQLLAPFQSPVAELTHMKSIGLKCATNVRFDDIVMVSGLVRVVTSPVHA